MLITGVTLENFRAYASSVSSVLYNGNVIIAGDSHDMPPTGTPGHENRDGSINRPQCRARLAVTDSRGPGSRTSASGRHGPYACWHSYRNVLRAVFERWPHATVTSGHGWRVTYRGEDGFRELYPGTGRVNIGGYASPVTMPELCNCEPWYGIHFSGSREAITRARERFSTPGGGGEYNENGYYWDCGRDRDGYDMFGRDRDGYDMFGRDTDSPNYVSPEVERASRQLADSEKLLSDPWSDKAVFGPDYDWRDDPKRYH
jgi:hypothetical protein